MTQRTNRVDQLLREQIGELLAREVAQGFECGIGLAGFHDLQEGDVIECFSTQTVSRSLTS